MAFGGLGDRRVERGGGRERRRIQRRLDPDAEPPGCDPLAVAGDDPRAGALRQHPRPGRPARLAPEQLDRCAVTIDVAVDHERDQIPVLERAHQLAEAVLGRHGLDRQLGLGLAHRGSEPATELHSGDREQPMAPVGHHDRRQLPVADVRAAQDHAAAARDRALQVLAPHDLDRAQQVLARQVGEAEEFEQHAVVALHHAARHSHAVTAGRVRHGDGEVGERGVAAGGEAAEVDLGQRPGHPIAQPQRHPRHEGGQPSEHQS